MKKFITMMVVALVAVSASAASFQWSSSAKLSFGETVLNSSAARATAYLVYLGADGAWSFGEELGTLANITDASVAETQTRTSGSAAVKGKYDGGIYGVSGNAGYSYGVVAVYNDGVDTWFNIASEIYTIPVGTLDNATGLATTFTHSSTVNETGVAALGSSQVGTGWYKVVAIPEPASAMLALAGVAMLIRRRK